MGVELHMWAEFRGGVCSASVNRLSDQSSQTDGREHLKHDLISSS